MFVWLSLAVKTSIAAILCGKQTSDVSNFYSTSCTKQSINSVMWVGTYDDFGTFPKKILYQISHSVSDYAIITATLGKPFFIIIMSVHELNIVSACILHKGNCKDKILVETYGTNSSCPFLSNVLDTFIGDI
jgi:hypothetical protein